MSVGAHDNGGAGAELALATLRESDFDLTGGDRPERLSGAIVTGSFFDVMGVAPALGQDRPAGRI